MTDTRDPGRPDPAAPAVDPDATEVALDVEGTADELAVTSVTGAEGVVGRWSSRTGRLMRTVLALGVFLVGVAVLWEAFKWLFGDTWRLENVLGTGIDYHHEPPLYLLQANDR